jgi:hypothetical protein
MADGVGGAPGGWPGWAKGLASAAIGLHLLAIGCAAFGAAPASPLQRRLSASFARYFGLIDQGYSYRYYAPEPPPTPVVEARLKFADGRPDRVVRLPDRATRPRMLYQRELALANSLFVEHNALRGLDPGVPDEARPPHRWAASYARHLGRVHGCREVELAVMLHLIPPLSEVQAALAEGGPAPALDDPRFYSVPELVGVFPCDGS